MSESKVMRLEQELINIQNEWDDLRQKEIEIQMAILDCRDAWNTKNLQLKEADLECAQARMEGG